MKETGPRLIEVALPIREISADSVRDKSLRPGHISTLHLWWARRPLAACRAIIFASLALDPDDPRCPVDFRAAVERYLKTNVPEMLKHDYRGRQVYRDDDPYGPYDGVPDTLRNRLLMFIAKWSPEPIAFEKQGGKQPKPENLIDDRCLVKWETSDPENLQGQEVLRVARELIKIAHAALVGQASSLSLPVMKRDDRPDAGNGNTDKQDAYPTTDDRQEACPTVLDPFADGGAIPLDAGRLGCRAIANDYNPVAYLILRATCEFPRSTASRASARSSLRTWAGRPSRKLKCPTSSSTTSKSGRSGFSNGCGRR